MTKLWSFSTGDRPNTVRAFERKRGGPLWGGAWDPDKKEIRRVPLGHRDKARAKRWAREQSTKLESGEVDAKVALAGVFGAYKQHRTHRKSRPKDDERRMEMFSRVFGPKIDPHSITLGQWEAFEHARLTGAIDAHGNPVPANKRRSVSVAVVEADLRWLRWVFNWAAKWRLDSGQYLMRENPVRGYAIPHQKNPRRPVATQDRYEAILAVADRHTMERRWNGKREVVRSPFREMFVVANGTGRRLTPVCELRFEDLRLARTKSAPYGAIRWPDETDKQGREWTAPISPDVRAALDCIMSERPGVGRAPLFPSPSDPSKPITRHLADKWLREAERMAKLEPLPGSLWHAYRRKWATERKHLPDVDVAYGGGWKSLQALKSSYQQSDPDTLLRVVLGGGELREAR